jgi:hypothetical protein
MLIHQKRKQQNKQKMKFAVLLVALSSLSAVFAAEYKAAPPTFEAKPNTVWNHFIISDKVFRRLNFVCQLSNPLISFFIRAHFSHC